MRRRYIQKSVGMSHMLSRFVDWAAHAPEGAGQYAPHSMIVLMRVKLGMTQAQLAKRCGLPQSHIAKIEKGTVDLQLGTLRRIFGAMSCRLVVAAQPRGSIEEIIESQARKTALRRVKRVSGTMAMEAQRPEDSVLESLVNAETKKLLEKGSSEIWEND